MAHAIGANIQIHHTHIHGWTIPMLSSLLRLLAKAAPSIPTVGKPLCEAAKGMEKKKRNSARHELKRLSLCVWLWYMIHIIRWTRTKRKKRVSATTFRRSLVADWEWWLKADAFSFFFPFICMTQTQWCGRCAVVERFHNFTDEDDEGETWRHASSGATIL